MPRGRLAFGSTIAFLTLFPAALIAYRVWARGYALEELLPVTRYRVQVLMSYEGFGSAVEVSTYLPRADARQDVAEEQNESAPLTLRLREQNGNRLAVWHAERVSGPREISYSYSVHAEHVRYELPDDLRLGGASAAAPGLLASTPTIQVDDPQIGETLERIRPPGAGATGTLRAIYDLTLALRGAEFKGTTDALTALRLGEASCNGKSRLFAALARRAGLPARLVGGLILAQGQKRVSHQWVEVLLNGHWVPFCPTNGYFAEIPASYLRLYEGDEVLFRHSPNIRFRYLFKIRRQLETSPAAAARASESLFHTADVWAVFRRLGIPLNLLKIILMLPVGALVVVVMRNVVGLETYGVFLPALIAAAARSTGIGWGLAGFALILLLANLVRMGIERLRILHTPKLAVILTAVVLLLLATSIVGVRYGFTEIAHVSLFPIAILTLTTERFATAVVEQGSREAFKTLGATMLVVWLCYRVMDSPALQGIVLAFPESLLVVVAADLWVGRWMGIRLLEYVRFRSLIFRRKAAA